MAKSPSKNAQKSKTSKVATERKIAAKPVAKKAVLKHAVKAVAKKSAAKPAARVPVVKKPAPAKPGMVKQLMQAMLGAGKTAKSKIITKAKPLSKSTPKAKRKAVVGKPKAKSKAVVGKPKAKSKAVVGKPKAKSKAVVGKAPVKRKPQVKTQVKPAVNKSEKLKKVVRPVVKPALKAKIKSPAKPAPAAKTVAPGRGHAKPSAVPVKPTKSVTRIHHDVVRAVAVVPSAKSIAKRGASAVPARKPEPGAERVVLPRGYAPTAKESYMSARQQEFFRQKLETWREDLVEESKQTIDNLREEVRDVGDEAERATRETENSLELRTRDRYRKLIAKIDEALRRIDEGQYGYCADTGDEIGLERLTARPTAERTVDAQERWEHRQKQMGE